MNNKHLIKLDSLIEEQFTKIFFARSWYANRINTRLVKLR